MLRWSRISGSALLCWLLVSGLTAASAATSATLDILPNDGTGGGADSVDMGSVKPLAQPSRDTGRSLPSGNPLWSIPLSVLAATQDRPIFSASRRPPQRAVVAPAAEQANAPVSQKMAEPDRPLLALIGAVVGDNDAIAVFLDRTNQKIVRLRKGDAHAGWMLNSVQRREVTLKKADQTEILSLQRPDNPGVPAAAGVPGLPVAGVIPFVPRSTPKNGESDGL